MIKQATEDFLWIANWKMLGSQQQLIRYAQQMRTLFTQLPSQLIALLPYPYLHIGQDHWQESANIKLGAQDVHQANSGAYTGSVSIEMLKDLGCNYVCIGHSERRVGAQEGLEVVAAKYQQVINNGLTPILCIGESAEENKQGLRQAVLMNQLNSVFRQQDLPEGKSHDIIIAYEPVWAIGSQVQVPIKQIKQTIDFIRQALEKVDWHQYIRTWKICYGGNVNMSNVAEIAGLNLSGCLLGRLAQDEEKFITLMHDYYGATN